MLVLLQNFLESIDNLSFAPHTLSLHDASVKEGSVFRGTPTDIIETFSGEDLVAASQTCLVHEIASHRVVFTTLRHLGVHFPGSFVILT